MYRNNGAYGNSSIGRPRDGASQNSALQPAFRDESQQNRRSIQDAGSSVIESIKMKAGRNGKYGGVEQNSNSLQPEQRGKVNLINQISSNNSNQLINAYNNQGGRESPAAQEVSRSNSQMR